MVDQLRDLKAETLVITDLSNSEAAVQKYALTIPLELPEMYTPIPYIIPAQLFAAYLAEQKGLNPDQPRTLSKVTRTM